MTKIHPHDATVATLSTYVRARRTNDSYVAIWDDNARGWFAVDHHAAMELVDALADPGQYTLLDGATHADAYAAWCNETEAFDVEESDLA